MAILSETDDSVDTRRQCEAPFGGATAVVAGDVDHDAVPNIGPIRMMVEFLGNRSDTVHERPCFGEIGEREFAVEVEWPWEFERSFLSERECRVQ